MRNEPGKSNGEPNKNLIRVRQGDSATETSLLASKRLRANRVVDLENGGEFAQKLVSVIEQTKRTMQSENIKVYQYTKLEIGQQVFKPQDEFQLNPKKIRHRIPLLKIRLSLDPQSLGDEWTAQ